jgi:hypothetical protein
MDERLGFVMEAFTRAGALQEVLSWINRIESLSLRGWEEHRYFDNNLTVLCVMSGFEPSKAILLSDIC